jgi:lambda repressor-like predicted transcriptional regulator
MATVACAAIAQPPLPELRVEAAPGGSVLFVRNTYSQPLTGYLIELVDYPGSSFILWRDAYVDDNLAYTVAGTEKRIPVTSMTVGAVPDYVKIRAAIYADGTSAGIAERVTLLLDRRRALLETTREAIRRVEKTPDRAALISGLNEWADTLRATGRSNGMSPAAIKQAVAHRVVLLVAKALETHPPSEVIERFRVAERELVESKPPLQ